MEVKVQAEKPSGRIADGVVTGAGFTGQTILGRMTAGGEQKKGNEEADRFHGYKYSIFCLR